MPNTAALVDVLKDNEKKKAFETVLDKRGLYRVYELATIHRDELTAIPRYFQAYSNKEYEFAPKVYGEVASFFLPLIEEASRKKRKEIKVKERAARDLTVDELKQVELDVRQSAEWKRYFKTIKVVLTQMLSDFAEKEFPNTPEFAAYASKKAEKKMNELAEALALEKEIDEILGLSVAVATGDSKEASRLSQSLSKKLNSKAGKGMSSGDVLKAVKNKLGRMFG